MQGNIVSSLIVLGPIPESIEEVEHEFQETLAQDVDHPGNRCRDSYPLPEAASDRGIGGVLWARQNCLP